MTTSKVNVLICGGGNAAHVATGLAASRESLRTSVLTLYSDEAECWANSLKTNDFTTLIFNPDGSKTAIKSKPELVTKEPADCVPTADIIIFTMPAFAHETYLTSIEPYIKENTTIVGLPGQPGFEFQCFYILKSKAKQCTVMSFETLPWACRISEFGKSVDLLGIKQTLSASFLKQQSRPNYNPLEILQTIMGEKPVLRLADNYLELSLFFAMVHPALMYGKWKDWDGEPVQEKPLFYQGVDDVQVRYVDGISSEMVQTARTIMAKRPHVDLSGCIHIFDWFKKYYSHTIADNSSLLSCMRSNSAYDGLTHPMKVVEGGRFVPDFHYRYLCEDIPFGLAVTKGLAEIAGYDTPITDEVMLWCQEKIGKEYLVGHQLQGKDLADTRAPQRFGFHTLDDLEALM
ncbi:opine dehydrogenase-like [Gigantopelta aegis]|uniref:opine dehydrogenase-like n=1 Tax=Gigantopelta aegis TaxID=1735272 RepID=UPI001B887A33|nr:opine dehydrogenase-like [Gigantopelta aegis]XP_041358384.1 opine dehydrogenase-like [Gigantopelta aegis]XP_041358385.1 opine dehydrogenase-like [Gigantopelta aegis]